MQTRLLDNSNTNFALVRSVEMQNETISYLCHQIKRTQDQNRFIQGHLIHKRVIRHNRRVNITKKIFACLFWYDLVQFIRITSTNITEINE